MMTVTLIPALSDNYIYLINWGNHAAVVDPGEAAPVQKALNTGNLKLDYILCTHHHADHVGGLETLKKETGCKVIGPEDERIQGIEIELQDGEQFDEDPLKFTALSVPGHTSIHLAFHFPNERWLFSGDALFSGGCGRLFEGTPEQMWTSLCKIMELPDDTQIFCGHEYTESNYTFALSLEPNNAAIAARLKEVQELRTQGKATVPFTLGQEKAINPFLRADQPELKEALGMTDAGDSDVFAEIRRRKDSF